MAATDKRRDVLKCTPYVTATHIVDQAHQLFSYV